jgi:flagellar protein FliO/FliZ
VELSLGRKIFFCIFLAVAVLPAFSQEITDFETQTTAVNPEESIVLDPQTETVAEQQLPLSLSRSPAVLFIRMIVVLVLIVACIYGVMRFFRRGMKNDFTSDPYLKRTASLTLTPGKTVHVITLDDNAFLIGVTDNAINLIGKIENKELVDAMNLHADEESVQGGPRDFSRLLDIFSGKRGKNAGTQSFSDSLEETVGVIRGQRSRISGLNTGGQDDTV